IPFGGGRDQLADQVQAGQLRHQVVDQQDVERSARQELLRLARAAERHDLVPFLAQRPGQRLADLGFVVYEQDGTGAFGHAVGASSGSSMRTSVPRSGSLATVIRPPRPSMMFREIARPMPVPVRRVVKKGSKTRGRSSGAMPGPLSETRMTNRRASSAAVWTRIGGTPGSPAGRPSTAWMALPITL